jgi:hypothetical protein
LLIFFYFTLSLFSMDEIIEARRFLAEEFVKNKSYSISQVPAALWNRSEAEKAAALATTVAIASAARAGVPIK